MLTHQTPDSFQSSGASHENHPLCVEHGVGPSGVHIPRVPGHRQNLPYFALHIVHNTVYSVFAVLLSFFFSTFPSTLRFESVLGCCREQVLGPLPDRVRCLLAHHHYVVRTENTTLVPSWVTLVSYLLNQANPLVNVINTTLILIWRAALSFCPACQSRTCRQRPLLGLAAFLPSKNTNRLHLKSRQQARPPTQKATGSLCLLILDLHTHYPFVSFQLLL